MFASLNLLKVLIRLANHVTMKLDVEYRKQNKIEEETIAICIMISNLLIIIIKYTCFINSMLTV